MKYIYDHGVEFEELTSSYTQGQGAAVVSEVMKNTDNFIISSQFANSKYYVGIYGTANKIDLSKYNRVCYVASATKDAVNTGVWIDNDKETNNGRIAEYSMLGKKANGKYLIVGDISSISSEYYTYFRTYFTDGTTNNGKVDVTMYEWWLE